MMRGTRSTRRRAAAAAARSPLLAAAARAVAALAAAPALAALLAVPAAAAAPGWSVPKPVERTLTNGLRVLVFPDARSGLVQVTLRLPAGVDAEPEGQSGLAQITAQLALRGTATRDAAAFARDQAALGATLHASAAREWATVSGLFLAPRWTEGLALVADAASSPVFLDSEVLRAVLQSTRAVEAAQASPAAVADERLWLEALAGHPGARPTSGAPEQLSRLNREAVRSFHRERWRPGGSVLMIAGAVEPEAAFAAAAEAFRLWSGAAAPRAAATPAARPARVVIVDRPAETVEVRLGAAVPGRAAADDAARSLAARLFEESLARRAAGWGRTGGDARAAFATLRDEGLWSVAASAPADSAATLVRRLRAAWRDALAAPPAAAEVRRAAAAAAGGFPFQFETLAGRLAVWNTADHVGATAALDGWAAAVRALTPADVHAAARRGLDLDRLTIVAVGPAARLEKALAAFGPVEVVRPAAAVAGTLEASPEEEAEGRRLVGLALAAHGGEAALRGILDSVTDSRVVLTLQGQIIEGRLRQMRKEPDKLIFLTSYQNVEQRQVLNGRRAWTQTSRGETREADSLGVETLRNGFHSDLPHLLRLAADPATRLAARGTERIGGIVARRVEAVLPSGDRRTFLFDAETHRLAAMDATEMVAGGPVPARRLYRDYRTVEGVVWPHEEERQIAGERLMLISTESVRFNTGVRDADFAPPSAAPAPGR
uniref:Insulinase family protein n=1 Tax=Eiseniibacteriota bacterium TaxID=2212470 RepID=A0A832I6H5_UNCEI